MLSIVSLPTFLEGARGSSERVLADPSKGGGGGGSKKEDQ